MEEKTTYTRRLEALLEECLQKLRALGIHPSGRILRIRENRRAKKRLGCCVRTKENGRSGFIIEVSAMLENCTDEILKDVIFHELIHTCRGCWDHGSRWKALAAQVNEAYGCSIRTRANMDQIPGITSGEAGEQSYKYEIICQSCGRSIYRMRRSRLVEHPENYRCGRCRGALKVRKL